MTQRIAVIGGGIAGCAVAAELAEAGGAVTVLERQTVGSGASGRNSGALEHPYDEAQVALHEETLAALRSLPGFAAIGPPAGVLLIAEALDQAEALAADYRRRFPDLEPRVLTTQALARREPFLAPGLVACELATGYPVPPALATELQAARARRAGAVFHCGAEAALEAGTDAVGVRWESAVEAFDAVVIAAGWQTGRLLADVGCRTPVGASWGVNVQVVLPRQPSAVLLEASVARVQSGGRGPTASHAAFSLIAGGETTALGSTWEPDEPDVGAGAARVRARGQRFVPALATAPITGAAACPRPVVPDGRPLLGRLPSLRNAFVLAGHGGRGISTGLASARLVADAVMARDDRAIPPPLRADRFA